MQLKQELLWCEQLVDNFNHEYISLHNCLNSVLPNSHLMFKNSDLLKFFNLSMANVLYNVSVRSKL